MTTTQPDGMPAWPTAKVTPPHPRALVSRQRLLRGLQMAIKPGHVTLVVAPGGTGKTTLLADWARQAPCPVAWYAIDTADRDLRRFLSGLCMAVERVAPGAARPALTALGKETQDTAVLGMLLGALEDTPLALVLDDFHHLDDQPDAVALWDHFLRYRPASLMPVIVSRSVPLLGFAALAALGEVTGLGRAELSFDAAEAADLLAAHGLDADSAAAFARRSGGWAAGLLLLAHSAPDGLRFVRARSEALMDHLGGEIIAALPDELRRFLLESAALGPAAPDEADAILERRDSALHYADLATRGLFLEQQDGLYRYHDLFAEYLASVHARENPDRLRALRRAAADWWSAQGDLPRALALLADAADWDVLAATLDRERGVLWARGLGGTVLAQMNRLPPSYHTPRLLTLCGYARSQRGEYAEALALADAGLARAADDEEWLGSALLRVQTLVYSGRYDEAIRGAEAALAVARAAGHARAITFLRELRGLALVHQGRLDEGRADLFAALETYTQAGDESAQARTLLNLATQLIGVGRSAEADPYLLRADTLWRRLHTTNNSVISDLHNSRALLHMLTGDLRAARPEILRAQAAAREGGYALLDCEAEAALAQVYADEGNATEAERHASVAAALAARLDMPEYLNTALRARIAAALLRRDRAGARSLLDEARPLATTPHDHALLDLLDGTLALRSGAHARAVALLCQAAAHLEEMNRPHSAARACLLQAEALLAGGSVRRAEDALNHMASLVLPAGCEGYLRPVARLARRVLAERRTRRHLWRDTRLVLDRLAGQTVTLSLLPPNDHTAPTPPALWLSPFGRGQIRLAGQTIDPTALPAKARELLFFAGRAGKPLSRDTLLDALWDGDSGAGPALWEANRHLRRLLGEDSWGREAGRYALRVSVHEGSRRFDETAAIALGSGALLERLAAAEEALRIIEPGSYLEWCDSLWATAERSRLTQHSMAVALALVHLYDELGRCDDAIAACRRAITLDPFDEAPRLALLRRLSASGQFSAVREEYKAYRRLLREELHEEPSSKLRACLPAREHGR